MSKKFKSFSGRLTRSLTLTVLVIMLLITVLVFIVAAAGFYMFSDDHYYDTMEKTNGDIAMMMSNVEVSDDNIIDELYWHLTTPDIVLSTLKYELGTNSHLTGCGIAFLPDYFPKEGRWFEAYALNGEDGIKVSNIGSETHDYFNAEWYLKGLESEKGVWSSPYLDSDGAGIVLCTYSRLVKDPDGKPVGVFGADISFDGLYSLLKETDRKENLISIWVAMVSQIKKDDRLKLYSFILGPKGRYVVHPDKDRILNGTFYDYGDPSDEDYKELGDLMLKGKSGVHKAYLDGIHSLVYYAPLMHSGWSMGIAVPSEVQMAPSLFLGTFIIVLILLGLLIVSLVSYFKIKKATRPLMKLAQSAQEVAGGNFDTELPDIKTNDEIRLLRDSFDNMQKSLSTYVSELTETTAQKASIENELYVARTIQMSMLPMIWPAFPDREDLDIYGILKPAKAVGGDLYDFHIKDGKLYFCVGDVSGKGIPASLVMTLAVAMFRTLSQTVEDPSKIVSLISSSMAEHNESMMFVTFFVGYMDIGTGEIKYCNAGHNAPVIVGDGEPRFLNVDSNVPIGVLKDWNYSLQTETLEKGCSLFLYTDGLTEATDIKDQLFGEKAVFETLSGFGKDTAPKVMISKVDEAVESFVGAAEQSDDLTMMVIKRLDR